MHQHSLPPPTPMLGAKPKTSHMLGMGSSTELYPEACFYFEILAVAWFSPEHPLYSSDRLCELMVLPHASPGPASLKCFLALIPAVSQR